MVSTYTPNLNLEEPARGDQVGTWDTPVNNNMTLLDLVDGGVTTISLNNSPVTLAAAQFQCKTIIFNSTLTGSVAITFPSTFKKSYEIFHACTGSSAFVITLQTTVAGSQVVCAPPGEICEVTNIGGNILFKNLGRVGTYWDYAGSSVPAWVSGCSVPPYLNCDGSAFSAVTYPQLAVICGGTTLPDSRNRARIPLAQGATRVSSGVSGISGGTLYSGGGSEQLHTHTHVMAVTDPGHTHVVNATGNGTIIRSAIGSQFGGGAFGVPDVTISLNAALTGISVSANNAGGGASQNVQPTYVGGLTLIRAG